MYIAILLLFIPCYLYAAIICVDDDNLSPTLNGSSQYPYSEIQAAINAASNFDTIKVAVGNYKQIANMGKSLFILGGFDGAETAAYISGSGGNFTSRTPIPAITVITGSMDTVGVLLTRFDFEPFRFILDNFTIKNNQRGIVCDITVSWPHPENVTISNNIIENNGTSGMTTGVGIFTAGHQNKILDNIIRNNHGGRGAAISGNFTPTDTLLIDGNLIEKNTGYDDHCGGIYLGGVAIIRNNVISGNRLQNDYGWGGGVLILGKAYMSFNILKDNYCPSYGGALFVDEGGTAYLDNELIYHNSTSLYGAAVALDNGEPGSSYLYMTNCTVVNNYSVESNAGNAVFLDVSSFGNVRNCIISGNTDDFFVGNGSELTVNYTLSTESYAGTGNFNANPLFADTSNEDFRLKSIAGRYNPTTKSWVNDDVHSPAIDAGDPSSSFDNEPTPNGNRINLGSYGNTIYASKSASMDVFDDAAQDGDLIVYPNPAKEKIYISVAQTPSSVIPVCEIYNVMGEIVHCPTLTASQSLTQEVDVSGLTQGMYYLSLKSGDKTITKQFAVVN